MPDTDHTLSPGPHLLVDDHLVEESRGLVRTTHAPDKVPIVPLPKAEPWHQQPLFFQTVLRDPDTGRFRIWYNVRNPEAHPDVGPIPVTAYAYAESDDGVHWHRPSLGRVTVANSSENNLIDAPLGDYFGLFLVDDGPVLADPSRRFKMAYYHEVASCHEGVGMSVAFSADGFQFTPYSENPVIPQNSGEIPNGESGYENTISDIIDGCWDPLRKQYLLGCKIEQGGYPGKPHYHREGWRRCVGVSVSHDFVHWRKPRLVVTPDPGNGIEEFYGFRPMVRGDLYIGFLRVLRDDLPSDSDGPIEGIGWTELITSRDGAHWTRYQETFLDRSREQGAPDHAMAWVADCVTVGDREYVYYGAYTAGHKIGDRCGALATLRKNGFVSRDAGAQEGTLRTPLVALDGNDLTVNARIEGEVRLRLLDERNEPIEGFDYCPPIRGDSVRHRVQWNRPLSALRARPVRMEFAMRQTQLYGWDLA